MDVNLEYCDPFDMRKHDIWMKIEHCGRYLYACDRIISLSGKSVIDAACANGYGSKMLASMGLQVYGLDRNKEYISFARAHNMIDGANYLEIDFDNDCFPSFLDKQDAIVCFETIEHVSNPIILLNKIYSSLKIGGQLLLSFPNKRFEKFDENGCNKDPYHKHVFDIEEIVGMLKKCGFRYIGKPLGQSICNIAYSYQSKSQKEGKVREEDIEKLFYYDELSIRKYATFLGYPNSYNVDDSYSYIIEAFK